MLDDLKIIHSRDSKDALGIARRQPSQYKYSYDFKWQAPRQINNLIIAGMGGSGLGAKFLPHGQD